MSANTTKSGAPYAGACVREGIREGEKLHLTTRQRVFLVALARCFGNITDAARRAKVARSTHYQWLRSSRDYKEAMKMADEMTLEAMEKEMNRRGFKGVLKPVYQGGFWVGNVRVFSDRMAELMARALSNRIDPGRYANREKVDVSGNVGVSHKFEDLDPVAQRAKANRLFEIMDAVGIKRRN